MTLLLLKTMHDPLYKTVFNGQLPSNATFSRAGNATYFDAAGNLAYAPHNMSPHSVPNSYWSKLGTTIETNSAIAANGTLTASKILDTEDNSRHEIYSNSGPPSVAVGFVYTTAYSVKSGTKGFVQIFLPSVSFGMNAYANFDLSNGTVGTVGSSATATISADDNGYYEISMSAACTTAGTPPLGSLLIIESASSARGAAYIGDGSGYVYVSWHQTNVGRLQPYYPTSGTAYYGPRYQYTNGVADGIILEEQRTNYALNGTPSVYKVNRVQNVTGPTGLSNAYTCTVVSTTDGARSGVTNAAHSAGIYTETVFIKAGTISKFQIETTYSTIFANFDIAAGTVTRLGSGATSASITPYANGWFRLQLNYTTASTTRAKTALRPLISGTELAAPILTFAGGETFYTYGEQLEVGYGATSYIPTTTVTATRFADVLSFLSPPWLNTTQGMLSVEAEFLTLPPKNTYGYLFNANGGTTNNALAVMADSSSLAQGGANVAGTTYLSATGATLTTGTAIKAAVKYKAGDNAIAFNGAVLGDGTFRADGVPSGLNRIEFGDRLASGLRSSNIVLKSFSAWNYAGTDEQLKRITT